MPEEATHCEIGELFQSPPTTFGTLLRASAHDGFHVRKRGSHW